MSDTQHTPGPWEEVPQQGSGPMIVHRRKTGDQMRPTGLRLIGTVLQRGDSLPEDEANARLIAAAPELLEALIAVTPSHRASGCWCGIGRDIEGSGHEQGCTKARAAIAKAEVRS